MTRSDLEDRVIAQLGVNVLLAVAEQAESWFRSHGAVEGQRSMRLFAAAIQSSRKRLQSQSEQPRLAHEALFIADQLREAAMQCGEMHAALRARLTGGAEMIERLCRARAMHAGD